MSEKERLLPSTSLREEEAYAWVVRLSSDQRTSQDEQRFKRWLNEDRENVRRFEEGLALWDELGAMRHSAQAHAALDHLYDASVADRRLSSRWTASRRGLLGAGLVSLAATGAGLLLIPKMLMSGRTVYRTAKGEQRRFTLADGSTVMLDTATMIDVAIHHDQRMITLVGGQAFFDVARDPSRPFRVFAGNAEIRALGTAFQVRYEGGAAKVVLEEGKVVVFRPGALKKVDKHPGADRLQAAKADIVLEPGQSVELVASKPALVASVDLSKTDAWRDGEMVFDDVPLPVAVAEVNRYGGPTVVLADPQLARLHISGTFHTNRPEAFVEGVTAALPVRLEESDSTKMVLKAA